jgi:hypothetical protein
VQSGQLQPVPRMCGGVLLLLAFLLSFAAPLRAEDAALGIPGEESTAREVPTKGPVARPDAPDTTPPVSTVDTSPFEVPAYVEPPAVDARPPEPIGRPGTLPDTLQAESLEYEADGTIVARGLTLTIESLVDNGGPAVIEAGHARINPTTQAAELSGGVRVAVEGFPVELNAEQMAWDPQQRKLSAVGLRLPLPLAELLGEEFPRPEIRARFAGHTRVGVPENVYLNVDSIEYVTGAAREARLRGIEIYPTPRPSADLYVTAREARIEDGERYELKGVSVYLEGLKVLTWPSFARGFEAGKGLISFETPRGSLDGDGNISLRQDIDVNAGPAHIETRLDYDPVYDLIAHSFGYVEPWAGAQFGVMKGSRIVNTYRREAVFRTDDFVIVGRQGLRRGPWEALLEVESGEVGAKLIEDDTLLPGARLRRFKAGADVELVATPLGSDWYFTAGASGAAYRYEDREDYNVVGGRVGLILRDGSFNNFVLYRENSVEGEPAFAFDAVRERELDLQTRVQLVPRLTNIVRAVYDFDVEDWDRLELGSLVQRDGYEVGFYWDFARDNAGLEFGVQVD